MGDYGDAKIQTLQPAFITSMPVEVPVDANTAQKITTSGINWSSSNDFKVDATSAFTPKPPPAEGEKAPELWLRPDTLKDLEAAAKYAQTDRVRALEGGGENVPLKVMSGGKEIGTIDPVKLLAIIDQARKQGLI